MSSFSMRGSSTSAEVVQIIAVGCIAGLLLVLTVPRAMAHEREQAKPAKAGSITNAQPAIVNPRPVSTPQVTTATRRFDLATLGPDAFADWDDSQR